MSKIGFIGLGIMGVPMAANILKGGHQLFAHDHKPLPADLAGQGAVACASGREVAQQADIIIIMVPDTPHVAVGAVRRRRRGAGAREPARSWST